MAERIKVVKTETLHLSKEDIANMPPKVREFFQFLQNLDVKFKAAAKNPPIGCAIDHGIYAGHDPDDE